MRRLSVLKIFVTIIFVLGMVTMVFSVPLFVIAVIMPGMIPPDLTFSVSHHTATELTAEDLLYALAILIAAGFWLYALYSFKKTLPYFEKKQFFVDDVIRNFNRTGKATIIGYLIYVMSGFIYYNIVAESITLDSSPIINTLFVLGLGLFFMVLSDVFYTAKKMKEENELTV